MNTFLNFFALASKNVFKSQTKLQHTDPNYRGLQVHK